MVGTRSGQREFRWSAGTRRVTGTRSEWSAGLRPPKWHFTGTRPAPNDLRTISWYFPNMETSTQKNLDGIYREIVRRSFGAGRVPVECRFGGLKPVLHSDRVPVTCRVPALHRNSRRGGHSLRTARVPVKCRYPARYRNSVRMECRFEAPKAALHRHSTGTKRSPHDLPVDSV